MAKEVKEEVDIFELLEQVERRKQPAIEALLAQRKEIDDKLKRLGYKASPETEEKRGGRPKGYKMTPEQKQAMRDGRAKAKADRDKQQTLPVE